MSASTTICPCCNGTGALGVGRPMVKVAEALRADAIPAAACTIYENSRSGRWPWLTRVGPSGRRDRNLWINVGDAVEWWLADGRPSVAARLLSLSKEGGGR